MKTTNLIATLATLAATATTANAAPITMRQDCIELVQNTILAAGGAETLDEESRKEVTILDARVIHSEDNHHDGTNDTYKTHATGNGIRATAIIVATRGGCLLDSMSLDGGKN
jgi:hypothetical protein